jgi:GT2 family glycosyltransferase
MIIPVIILNWNGWEDTFDCLRSILACDKNVDTWLVDNGSAVDRSPEAQAVHPGLRILRWDDNYGWADGYNRALKVAVSEGYEFAYLLNNDCKVAPGFLSAVLEVMQRDTQLATVGSFIAYENPAGFLKFDGEYHLPGVRRVDFPHAIKEVHTANGAGMLVRLSAMEKDGYFDERFFCYGEEEEWCWRMRMRGWAIALSEKSIVMHKCEASNINSNSTYYRTRNFFLTQKKCKQLKSWKAQAHFTYCVIRSANEARRKGNKEEYLAFLRALQDGLTGKFGKRKFNEPGTFFYLLAYIWPFPSGFFRRMFSPIQE